MTINPLLARFADVPALIEPRWRRGSRPTSAPSSPSAHHRADVGATLRVTTISGSRRRLARAYRPYVVRDGVLRIPVKGVLLHDFPFAFGSWATGYTYIARALDRGLPTAACAASRCWSIPTAGRPPAVSTPRS
jgi:hypothetical protein